MEKKCMPPVRYEFFRVKPIMFSGAAVVVVVNSPYFFDKGGAASVNFVESLSW